MFFCVRQEERQQSLSWLRDLVELQTHHRLLRSLLWIGFVVVFYFGSWLFPRRKSSGDFSESFYFNDGFCWKADWSLSMALPSIPRFRAEARVSTSAGCHALTVTRSPDILFPWVFVYMPRQNGSGISVALQQKVRAYISQINAKSRWLYFMYCINIELQIPGANFRNPRKSGRGCLETGKGRYNSEY